MAFCCAVSRLYRYSVPAWPPTTTRDRTMYTTISCLMLTALLVFGAAFPHAAKSDESAAPVDSILVFDASGSMWARMDGVEKIVVARDVVGRASCREGGRRGAEGRA